MGNNGFGVGSRPVWVCRVFLGRGSLMVAWGFGYFSMGELILFFALNEVSCRD